MGFGEESSNNGGKHARVAAAGDKYRKLLKEETEDPNIVWRHGGPPNFDAVNKLFEETRTKVWEEGSLEEAVQNAVKTWEMELSHKTRLLDFRTINPRKFQLIVNGREGLSGEETLRQGSYNALLKNTLPEQFRYYKVEEESFETSHDAFRSAFPRGFAWEVDSVYSGPPVIAFKFRHWGFFEGDFRGHAPTGEGDFRGHAPTGEMVQFYGIGIMKVDESMRAEEVEIYYDPAELFGDLLKGTPPDSRIQPQEQEDQNTDEPVIAQSCPFSNHHSSSC